MLLILDTNIAVSGLLFGGKPELLLRAVRNEMLDLVTSVKLVAELTRILHKPKFQKMFLHTASLPSEVVATYTQLVRFVEPIDIPRTAVDPDDDIVLATAKSAGADLIVSGDRHLLDLVAFEGIPILSVTGTLIRLGLSTSAR